MKEVSYLGEEVELGEIQSNRLFHEFSIGIKAIIEANDDLA